MFRAPIKWWTSTSVRSYYNVIKTSAPKPKRRIESPLITCRRPEFNIQQGDRIDCSSNADSMKLCSNDWLSAANANDHFTIHPSSGHIDQSQQLDPSKFDVHPQLLQNLSNELQTSKVVKLLQMSNGLDNEHTWIRASKESDTIYSFLLPIVRDVLKGKASSSEENAHEFNAPKALIITQRTISANRIGELCDRLLQDIHLNSHVLRNEEFESSEPKAIIRDVDIVITSVDTLQRSQFQTQNIYKWHSVQYVVLNGADELFDNEETIEDVLQPILQFFPVIHDILLAFIVDFVHIFFLRFPL